MCFSLRRRWKLPTNEGKPGHWGESSLFPTTIFKKKEKEKDCLIQLTHQTWVFQAWNSMSSRDILAQLATATIAATTTSSFILPEKKQTDPVWLAGNHRGLDWALSLHLVSVLSRVVGCYTWATASGLSLGSSSLFLSSFSYSHGLVTGFKVHRLLEPARAFCHHCVYSFLLFINAPTVQSVCLPLSVFCVLLFTILVVVLWWMSG